MLELCVIFTQVRFVGGFLEFACEAFGQATLKRLTIAVDDLAFQLARAVDQWVFDFREVPIALPVDVVKPHPWLGAVPVFGA